MRLLTMRLRVSVPFVDGAIQDVALAIRILTRNRGFAVTATLVLGLGIGVTHMFLTIVYAHTWRGLPVPRPDRLLYVSVVDERGVDRPLSRLEFDEIRTSAGTLASVVAFTSGPVAVGDEGRAPDRFEASYVGLDAFATVGVTPLHGRDFMAEDHRPGAAPVVLLGHDAWRARYGEDPGLLGRSILVNGSPANVVGVVPDASGFPSTAAIWMPLAQAPEMSTQAADVRNLRVLGRMRDDVALADVRTEIERVMAGVAARGPGTEPAVRARVMPINERLLGRIEGPWLAFVLAGCVIVLISCANIANLMLARGFHRAREVAVRASLGASRGRLLRQLMTESLVIGLVGGAAGLVVSLAGVRIFGRAIPAGTLPYWLAYTIDGHLLLALLAVSTASALLFGLVPALLGSRTDIHAVLRDGGRSQSASRAGRPWIMGFLSAEIALSVVLLVGIAIGGLALRSQVPSDRIVDTTAVVAATVTLPTAQYATPESRARFLDGLLERVGQRPTVAAASVTTNLPLSGASERQVRLDGSPPNDEAPPVVASVGIGPAYFATLGLGVLRGREFTQEDGRPGAAVALVNERFVERFVLQGDAVGTRIAVSAPGTPRESAVPWLTIVGVVPALRQRSRPAESEPLVYLPLLAAPPATTTLVVQSTAAPGVTAAALRADAQAGDANVPLYRIQTLAQVLRDADWNPRLSAQLANTLTLLCLLLTTVGLYAVTAHAVSLRRRELGIRMALGATPRRIAALALSGARVPLGLGLLLGLAGAGVWNRSFPSGRADLTVTNPSVLGLVVLVLALVTLAACIVPARRAARLDPAVVLRQE